ncbi:MAG: hypothetical protein ACKVT0_00200 [Planctomycetaceae bacterium]
MVRSMSLVAVVFALLNFLPSGQQVDAENGLPNVDVKTAKTQLLAQNEPKATTRKAPAGRVPSGWAKIGLSAEQKKNIYEIQAKYKEQTDELEKQIEELKAQRDNELMDLLTDEQKAKLKTQSKSSGTEKTEKSESTSEESPKSNDK